MGWYIYIYKGLVGSSMHSGFNDPLQNCDCLWLWLTGCWFLPLNTDVAYFFYCMCMYSQWFTGGHIWIRSCLKICGGSPSTFFGCLPSSFQVFSLSLRFRVIATSNIAKGNFLHFGFWLHCLICFVLIGWYVCLLLILLILQ